MAIRMGYTVSRWVDNINDVPGYDVLPVRREVDTVLSIIKEPKRPNNVVSNPFNFGTDLKGFYITDGYLDVVDTLVSNLNLDCEGVFRSTGVATPTGIICTGVSNSDYPIGVDIRNSFILGTSTIFYPYPGTNILGGRKVSSFVSIRNKVNRNRIGISNPVFSFSVNSISSISFFSNDSIPEDINLIFLIRRTDNILSNVVKSGVWSAYLSV